MVVSKIENQARALSILGLDGAEEVWSFSLGVCPGGPDNREGVAARCYFQHLQPGLNRRCRDPLNSALNYGAAIVRAAMARSLVVAGFVPALGIRHHSQLSAFNLADDIMEPLRPVVDILALEVVESSCELSRQQRSKLRGVLLRTVCRGTKTEYTAYRKRLVALGYSLVQPEVYIRAVPSRKTAARCLRDLEEHVPTTGSIRAFCMTERQFAGVRYLVGGRDYQEERVGVRTMVEL